MRSFARFWRIVFCIGICATPLATLSASTSYALHFQAQDSSYLEAKTPSSIVQEIPSSRELELLLADYFKLSADEPQKALRALKKAARVADRTFADRAVLSDEQLDLWQQAEGYLALFRLEQGRYLESDEHWGNTYAIHERVMNESLRIELEMRRALLDSALLHMNFTKTKEWLRDIKPTKKITSGFSESTRKVKADMDRKLFTTYARKGKVNAALKHYKSAFSLFAQLGDEEALNDLEGEYQLWLTKMDSTISLGRKNEEVVFQAVENDHLETLKAEAEAIENSGLSVEQSNLFKRYKSLQQEIAEEEKRSALALQEKESQIQNQELEILLLEQENDISTLSLHQQRLLSEEETRKKRNLTMVLALVFALLLSVFILYRYKIRANRQLRQAKDELDFANKKVAGLLQEQLSGDIADTLIKGETNQVKETFVAVMFVDIREFTPKVAQLKPEEINRYQNKVFGFMIDIIEAHHGNINQLLGDGFMASFGAPKSFGNDVQNAVDAGIAILAALAEINTKGEIPKTEIGIGLDCGTAVMGNVGGSGRKQFSLTGNVVISAARIEQANKTIGSHFLISEAAQKKSKIDIECRAHKITLKGREGARKLYELLLITEPELNP